MSAAALFGLSVDPIERVLRGTPVCGFLLLFRFARRGDAGSLGIADVSPRVRAGRTPTGTSIADCDCEGDIVMPDPTPFDTEAPAPLAMAPRRGPQLGPSDSSDSASDVIGQGLSADPDPSEPVDVAIGPDGRRPGEDIEAQASDAQTDAAGTGERRSAANDAGSAPAHDVAPDRIDFVSADDELGEDDAADDDPDLGQTP